MTPDAAAAAAQAMLLRDFYITGTANRAAARDLLAGQSTVVHIELLPRQAVAYIHTSTGAAIYIPEFARDDFLREVDRRALARAAGIDDQDDPDPPVPF